MCLQSGGHCFCVTSFISEIIEPTVAKYLEFVDTRGCYSDVVLVHMGRRSLTDTVLTSDQTVMDHLNKILRGKKHLYSTYCVTKHLPMLPVK
jgi:hypothetical protein